MDVIEIPTNRPIQRIDHQDAVLQDQKRKAACDCGGSGGIHAKGAACPGWYDYHWGFRRAERPSEEKGNPHKVLNAKFHELEAEIFADAGIHGAVTIATNMAGRGTDIKLDDNAKAAGGLGRLSVRSGMSPGVSTISCADVPDDREIQVNPSFTFRWKMI